MNGRVWSGICAALVLAMTITVVAQDPPSAQAAKSQSASAKTITVTGCVERAKERAAGTTGTGGAAPSGAAPSSMETKFVLTNASLKPSEPAGAPEAAAPPTTAIASEYKLDTDESKLSMHVGHKVEITGTVEQPDRTEQKPPASAANAPKLKVDSVKMVAATCQ